MTDPIRLPVSLFHRSPPAVTKIKRGGTGKISNSGNAAGRFHTPIRQLRSTKDGKQIPWRPRGAVIWDPTPPIMYVRRIMGQNTLPSLSGACHKL